MAKMLILVLTVICMHSTRAYLEFENPTNNAFDTELYVNVLDKELCEKQLSYIKRNNSLLMAQFLDAGLRTPRGILKGNLVDLGNYHQCLEIKGNFGPSNIEGKYCMINVPLTQANLELPTLPEWPDEWPEFPWPELLPNTREHRDLMRDLQEVLASISKFSRLTGPDMDLNRVTEGDALAGEALRLAVCVPKTCTPKQFIETILINTTAVGFEFTEDFCRLINDKPFVLGDYGAIFLADFTSALVIGFIVTVMIDSPFSVLIKLVMGPKSPRSKKIEAQEENEGANENVRGINSAVSRDNDMGKTKF